MTEEIQPLPLGEKPALAPEHQGVLPGRNTPYFLNPGDGEKSVVFDTLFTVYQTGDESQGQFDVFGCEGNAGDIIPAHIHLFTNENFFVVEGAVHLWVDDEKGMKADRVLTAGGFGYIPSGTIHAFRLEATSKIIGSSTAGFGRFFHAMGTPTTDPAIPTPGGEQGIYVPSREQMMAAGQLYGTVFRPDYDFLND